MSDIPHCIIVIRGNFISKFLSFFVQLDNVLLVDVILS